MKYRAKAAPCLTFGCNGGKSKIVERKVVEKQNEEVQWQPMTDPRSPSDGVL